jgi:hypothetical protein
MPLVANKKETIMFDESNDIYREETRDQFIQRAGALFPPDRVRAWSRIERTVFNHLFAQLIQHHSYALISNQMLQKSRADMEEIVRRCSGKTNDGRQERSRKRIKPRITICHASAKPG